MKLTGQQNRYRRCISLVLTGIMAASVPCFCMGTETTAAGSASKASVTESTTAPDMDGSAGAGTDAVKDASSAPQKTETQTSGTAAPVKTITGFEEYEKPAYYFEGEPTEAQLTQYLPETVSVHMDGSDKLQKIAVEWQIVEDYEDSDFYFYSLKPVWDKDVYQLSENLLEEKDVPWLLAFRKRTEAEIKQGNTDPVIPLDDIGDLSPLYIDDSGSSDPAASEAGTSADGTAPAQSSDPSKASEPTSLPTTTQPTTTQQTTTMQPTSLLEGLFGEPSYAAPLTVENAVYTYLTKNMGLNRAAASGVMTNLYAESGLLSNNLENMYNLLYGLSDKEYTARVNKGKKQNGKYKTKTGKTRYFTKDYCGYGIAQWTSLNRRKNLLAKANKKNVPIDNLSMQLEFLKEELVKHYPQVWKCLKSVPDTEEGAYLAAAEFCTVFEVPANTSATAASRGRAALRTYWKRYSGKAGSVTGKSFLGLCGYMYPITVKTGKSITCSGFALSNYRITKATATIKNSSGKTIYKKTFHPLSLSFNMHKFDNAMKFSKLKSGTYVYYISVKDGKKTVSVGHRFTVSDKVINKTARGFTCK